MKGQSGMSGENRIAELQGRLAEFVPLVRLNDFHVGVAEEIDARRVALNCGLTDGQRLHWGLRALLCSDQDEWERFDELFDAYWRSANMRSGYQAMPAAPVDRELSRRLQESARQRGMRDLLLAEGLDDDDVEEILALVALKVRRARRPNPDG